MRGDVIMRHPNWRGSLSEALMPGALKHLGLPTKRLAGPSHSGIQLREVFDDPPHTGVTITEGLLEYRDEVIVRPHVERFRDIEIAKLTGERRKVTEPDRSLRDY